MSTQSITPGRLKLTPAEIEFLSAWAREEWAPECYQAHAHRLQLAHGISGALLIEFINAWTVAVGKKDQEIVQAADNPEPNWPWSMPQQFESRLAEAINMKQTTNAISE